MKRGISNQWACPLVILCLLAPASLTGQEGRYVHACGRTQLLVGTGLSEMVPVDSAAAFRVLVDPDDILLGQKFLVERAKPAVGRDTVLLVRWRRTPDSPPLRWRGPEPRVEPGEKRFIGSVLRDANHWASGYPTVDVQDYIFPDPRDRHLREMAAAGPMMTADEVYDFCSLSVNMNLVDGGDWSREIAPMAWARESRGAWRKQPAAFYLMIWAEAIENARIRRLPADVAGTYAAHLDLPSGRTLPFFFRTSGEIHGSWNWPWDPARPPDEPPWEFRQQGYKVNFWIALEEEDLPDVQGDPAVVPCRDMFEERSALWAGVPPGVVDPACIEVGWPWKVGLSERREPLRRGLWEPDLIKPIFGEDEEVADLMDQWSASFSERRSAGEEIPARGLFLPGEGGAVQYRQDISVAPGQTLTLTAVRISQEVVRDTSG